MTQDDRDLPHPDRDEIEETAEEALEAAQEAREAAEEARQVARQRAQEAMARMRERTAAGRRTLGNLGSALKETAADMLHEARRGANEAQDEMWARYEAKTRHRRTRKHDSED